MTEESKRIESMGEIEHITGPAGAPEGIRRHERTAADAEKFKQEMSRKMSQVSESDPEQQKKRKQQAEEEDEEDEVLQEPERTPASQVTPFDLQKQVSPMDLGEGGKISPLASAQPQKTTTTAPSPYVVPPSSAEVEEEPSYDAGSASIFTISQTTETQPQSSYPQSTTPPGQQPISTSSSGQAQPQEVPRQQVSSSEQSQQREQQDQDRQRQGETQEPPATAAKPLPEAAPQISSDLKQPEEKKPTAMQPLGTPSTEEPVASGIPETELPEAPMLEREGIVPLEEMGQPFSKDREGSLLKKEEEELAAEGGGPHVVPISAPGATEGGAERDLGKKKKEFVGQASSDNLGMPTPQLSISGETPMASPPPPAYTTMSPQVLDLYERMVGVMTIMTDSKMTETVITLSAPQFASSVFYGTQIIIREYTSAPKAFNIELSGNPQAVAMFQGNTDELMAAFQYGNYNFRVNRLDTSLASERPLFHRKEKVSGDKQEQRDQGQQ